MISDFYNIQIANLKKLVPIFFAKEMYVLHCEKLQLELILGLKLKKINHVLEYRSITMAQNICNSTLKKK